MYWHARLVTRLRLKLRRASESLFTAPRLSLCGETGPALWGNRRRWPVKTAGSPTAAPAH